MAAFSELFKDLFSFNSFSFLLPISISNLFSWASFTEISLVWCLSFNSALANLASALSNLLLTWSKISVVCSKVSSVRLSLTDVALRSASALCSLFKATFFSFSREWTSVVNVSARELFSFSSCCLSKIGFTENTYEYVTITNISGAHSLYTLSKYRSFLLHIFVYLLYLFLRYSAELIDEQGYHLTCRAVTLTLI